MTIRNVLIADEEFPQVDQLPPASAGRLAARQIAYDEIDWGECRDDLPDDVLE